MRNSFAAPLIPPDCRRRLLDRGRVNPDFTDIHGFSEVQKTTARLFPGNQFHGSTVDLLQSPRDFLAPRVLDVLAYFRIQTVQKGRDQRGARLTITRAYTS